VIYALDTNTISFLLRARQNPEVADQFAVEIGQGNDYVIPPLSYYEITWYLMKKGAAAQLRCFSDLCQGTFTRTVMDEHDLLLAAQIRVNLEDRGKSIGDADILIAAYCIANDYTLVTDNTNDFKLIDGLKIVNWKKRTR